MSTDFELSDMHRQRLFPKSSQATASAIPLSLLDATTVNFALTSALWLFEPWQATDVPGRRDTQGWLRDHLRDALSATLDAYPQWCGHLKTFATIDGRAEDEARHFSPHARRFGRVYVHYGTSSDPGVEFISCRSPATLATLYPESRAARQPIWNRQEVPLRAFVADTDIARPSSGSGSGPAGKDGLLQPLLAIQLTELACGGFVVAAKISHPLADISSLVQLVRDWSAVSSAMLGSSPMPALSPLFDPSLVDSQAAGDIDAEQPDGSLVEQTRRLPLHRYDWWAPSEGAPWPSSTPSVFLEDPSGGSDSLAPAGKAMPWSEWDVGAHVSHYTIHLTHDQVEHLWRRASAVEHRSDSQPAPSLRVSRHDAVLAHVWSCVTRARGLQHDAEPVYCDLVYGLRPVLGLGASFLGSPILMANAALPGTVVSGAGGDEATGLAPLAHRIRQTLDDMGRAQAVAAHLHTVAHEKSPQRIWQAFLGRRHILVTTWARARLHDVDFGLGAALRYADGFTPEMDGNILIKEAPPPSSSSSSSDAASSRSWTRHGVDVSINICDDAMARLIEDPLLLPGTESGGVGGGS